MLAHTTALHPAPEAQPHSGVCSCLLQQPAGFPESLPRQHIRGQKLTTHGASVQCQLVRQQLILEHTQ